MPTHNENGKACSTHRVVDATSLEVEVGDDGITRIWLGKSVALSVRVQPAKVSINGEEFLGLDVDHQDLYDYAFFQRQKFPTPTTSTPSEDARAWPADDPAATATELELASRETRKLEGSK